MANEASTSLYALTKDYHRLIEFEPCPDCNGEGTDTDDNPCAYCGGEGVEPVHPYLMQLRVETAEDLLQIARAAKTLDAEAKLIGSRIDELTRKSRVRVARASGLKDYVLHKLDELGLKKVKDLEVTVWRQKSPKAVNITNPIAIPGRFWRAVIHLNRDEATKYELQNRITSSEIMRSEVAKAIEAGEAVPGAEITQGEHLRIQ